MRLIPDDFWPFQIEHVIGTGTINIYGSRRKAGQTTPGSTKVVSKDVADLSPTRRQRLAAIRNKLLAQVAEDGYTPTRLVLNLDAPGNGAGLVVEGYYEFADGSKSSTHIKQFRLEPLTQDELDEQEEPQNPEHPETFEEPADLTEAERGHYRDLIGNLRQLARQAEGFP